MKSAEGLVEVWTWCGFIPEGLRKRRARRFARDMEAVWQEALLNERPLDAFYQGAADLYEVLEDEG